ncbi:hypothetical protein [Streptomyces sp. NPDC003077]|uniref:hypothetical protein n=1 Tax=Streptomyces sp. NPDC003077 TaxID=3154443 RepID=UPI00339E322D
MAGPTAPGARHRGLPRLLASVLLCLATVSAGCAATPDAPTAARPSSADPRPLTGQERQVLRTAEQVLTRRCMTAQGFRMWPTPPDPVPDARDFPYVVDDPAWAARHGYGSDLQRRIEAVRAADPNRRYLRGLPPARRAAALAALNGAVREGPKVTLPDGTVLGRSRHGCTSAALRDLYGDLDAWFRVQTLTDNLSGTRQSRVFADPAYRDAIRQWSTCMNRRGHDYADPGASRAAFADPRTPAQRAREIATAVDEARCARDSGLAATARRLDRHYDATLRTQYRTALQDRLRREHAALPRARAVAPSPARSPSTHS